MHGRVEGVGKESGGVTCAMHVARVVTVLLLVIADDMLLDSNSVRERLELLG